MNENKKRWVPIFFPMGEFNGSVNIAISGKHVVTAEQAKELIDSVEKTQYHGDNKPKAIISDNTGSACR